MERHIVNFIFHLHLVGTSAMILPVVTEPSSSYSKPHTRWSQSLVRAFYTTLVIPVPNYGLERFETGLLCPRGFVLPLARTTVSLLGLLLDVQPASLLGPKTLHRAPGDPVTLDGNGPTEGGGIVKFSTPLLEPPRSTPSPPAALPLHLVNPR